LSVFSYAAFRKLDIFPSSDVTEEKSLLKRNRYKDFNRPASSNVPNSAGCLPPLYLATDTDPVSETLHFKRTQNDGTCPKWKAFILGVYFTTLLVDRVYFVEL
jgi:hypothetical protein